MRAVNELEVLDHYYHRLEQISEYCNSFLPEMFDWDASSPELRFQISVEYNALTHMSQAHIMEVFGPVTKESVKYLEERLQTSKNNLLRAKYFHFLFYLCKNNQYGKSAIEEYKLALPICLLNDKDQKGYVNFKELLNTVIGLTERIKYQKEEFKTEILNYLSDDKIYGRLKTWIALSASESGLFKPEELHHLPDMLCKLAATETEHRFIEINLELALKFAVKLKNAPTQKKINELLGDNEYLNIRAYDGKPESIAIPHQNNSTYIKIIQYYKDGKNDQKRDQAILAYNANKKNCRFLKITGTAPIRKNYGEMVQSIDDMLNSITSSSTKPIIAELIYGRNLLFIPDELLNQSVKDRHSALDPYLKPVWNDLNNNQKGSEPQDDYKFRLYKQSLNLSLNFATEIILVSLQNKRLSLSKLSKTLMTSTFFGQEITITRDGQDLSYKPFEMINVGIAEFLKQCLLLLKGKEPDWRIPIDFLSLKFEGILRDIISLSGGVTTKIEKRNSTELLLDDLLRSNVITDVFDPDDLNLFQYTFTSKGYNIRNNVAHSFYKPFDYPLQYAFLVFLCVLRLAKFKPASSKNSQPT